MSKAKAIRAAAVMGSLLASCAVWGCSGDDPATPATGGAPAATAGVTSTGGTSSTGGTASSGGMSAQGGVINSASTFTILSGDAATPGGPAPAMWPSNCGFCHGANGEGTTALAPEIRHVPTAYGTWVVRHGRMEAGTGMAAYDTGLLPDVALGEILTWLRAMPKPAAGQQLYLDHCANCHGPDGTRGALQISVVDKPLAEVTQKVRNGVGTDPAMRLDYMPAFPVADLTDAELALITAFIRAK